MKKTHKKTDNAVREALSEVCEWALDEVSGFQWLTHFADYSHFPSSLAIVCVFETNNDLSSARGNHQDDYLRGLIKDKLNAVGIDIKDIKPHLSFDTEEACENENAGKWNERFR